MPLTDVLFSPYFQPVNHSTFNLEITEMAEKICPLSSHIPLMKVDVSPGDSEVTANKTTNKPLSSESGGTVSRGTANDVKENEPSKRHTPTVVFLGHSEHEWPELLPEFVNFHDGMTDLETVSASQKGSDDSMFPDSLKEEEDDSYWPHELSAPEFATAGYYGILRHKTSGENPDNTGNANFPESRENPASKDPGLIEEIPSREGNQPRWLKNAEDETPGQIDPVDARSRTMNHLENTDKCTEGVTVKESDTTQISDVSDSTLTVIPYNGTLNYEDLVCAHQPVDVGYWKQEDDDGVYRIKDHENLHFSISDMTPLISTTRDDTPLQATRVKKAMDTRTAHTLINESEFCLAGKNRSGPVSVITYLDL